MLTMVDGRRGTQRRILEDAQVECETGEVARLLVVLRRGDELVVYADAGDDHQAVGLLQAAAYQTLHGISGETGQDPVA